jgi:hypothetical protein
LSILIRSAGAESWKQFLADPSHWRTGYSAKSLAYCWSESQGLPGEVDAILGTAATFAQSEVLIAVPEHKVQLPGVGKASQTDLWLLLRTPAALTSVAVEGKVDEPFGETVGQWLRDGSANKSARLDGLSEILGLTSIPATIRYQLVHRTASAILEARRFLASHAIMLIHSFSPTAQWFDDFQEFCHLFGVAAVKDRLAEVPGRSGPTLHLGWVTGDARFLTR